MNKKNIKRWNVIRKSTGKLLRSFTTRDAARDFKMSKGGADRAVIIDSVREVVVR